MRQTMRADRIPSNENKLAAICANAARLEPDAKKATDGGFECV